MKTVRRVMPVIGLLMVVSGAWLGLSYAPPDREMGDAMRIMYIHVPCELMMLACFTVNCFCSVAFLFSSRLRWDAMSDASAEVGLLFGSIGIVLGSIWARPTWGVWWTWDPRLTWVAITLVVYAGYVTLRKFVDNPERRAVLSSVSGILMGVAVPIIYVSVKVWNGIHQVQSSPKTVDPRMVIALRWNITAFFVLMIVFLTERYLLALVRQRREVTVPEALPPANAPLRSAP